MTDKSKLEKNISELKWFISKRKIDVSERAFENIQYVLNETETLVKKLIISDVSQQHELLEAYDKFAEMEHAWFIGTEKETKDKFLIASNCG